MQRSFHSLSLLASLLLLSGCDRSPATYPVKGKVTFKGTGQPLTRGTIVLESVAEPKVLASGEIAADGTFELSSNVGDGKSGTTPGEYRVMIQEPYLETGEKPQVQAKYQRLDSSGLGVTVQPGGNDLTIEIDAAKP
jgi:hypothetical protein